MTAGTPTSPTPEPLQFSLRKLFRTITVLALLLGLIVIAAKYLQRRDALRQAERARLEKLDRATVVTIVTTVESIRAQLGRAPADTKELEKLMGQPMPFVHDNGYPRPISYHRTGDDSFILQNELWATDDWIYDSKLPSAGWVQHWY
jgi:hypothetical protein